MDSLGIFLSDPETVIVRLIKAENRVVRAMG
jgi:hypothetical protein